jgi:hypothetical protein
MVHKCFICCADLSELGEADRISHENLCLDKELEKSLAVEESKGNSAKPQVLLKEENKDYDLEGMPDYESMPTSELKKHLDSYGMKKTLESKQAKITLKETWLYLKYGVFPSSLSKYV